jgi:hypothetical protein
MARPLLLLRLDRDAAYSPYIVGGGIAMSAITLSSRVANAGQIALEYALFCLECELIFAGAASCPRCTSEAVWPLAEWVHPIRPAGAVSKREDNLTESSHYESA